MLTATMKIPDLGPGCALCSVPKCSKGYFLNLKIYVVKVLSVCSAHNVVVNNTC